MRKLLDIIFTIVFIGLGLMGIYLLYQASQIKSKPQTMSYQEIVKFCQSTYATSTKDDFGYKSCLQEMRDAGGSSPILKI